MIEKVTSSPDLRRNFQLLELSVMLTSAPHQSPMRLAVVSVFLCALSFLGDSIRGVFAARQMYEFRLGIDRAKIPVRSKYILAVTYLSPAGDRLTDQCFMDAGSVAFRPSGRPLRGG